MVAAMKSSHPWVAVVDDEASIRRALCRLLRSAGIEARTFAGGAALFDALAGAMPFCVLLDLHMPWPSGLEVLTRLARETPAIAVIVVTGDDSASLRQQVALSNPISYLNKPMSDHVLLEAVMRAARRADWPP
jgi:FixJ family two-component response regulator